MASQSLVQSRAAIFGQYRVGPSASSGAPLSRRVFEKYDKDRSGHIEPGEFREMVYEMGYHLSDQEFELAIRLLDKDGDKKISYDEFASWWRTDERFKKLQRSPEELAVLAGCADFFQAHDDDGNGVLDRAEFAKCHAVLVSTGVTDEPIEACFAQLDANGDGSISFNEYVDWLIANKKLHGVASAAVELPDPVVDMDPAAKTRAELAMKMAANAAQAAAEVRQRRLQMRASSPQ